MIFPDVSPENNPSLFQIPLSRDLSPCIMAYDVMIPNQSHSFPTALVVGAAKAATSWLYKCLDEHPDTFVPRVKEIDFFSKHYYRGFDWYSSHFDNHSEERAAIDISPTYMIDPGVPARVQSCIPETKLIFCLRNPIERAYSHYCMHLRGGFVSDNINTEISTSKRYLREGLYYKHISRYLRYFNRSDMLFLVFDDLEYNPKSYLKKMYRFLDVDKSFEPTWINERYHIRKTRPKYQTVQSVFRAITQWVQNKNIFRTDIVEFARRTGLSKLINEINRGEEYPMLMKEKRKEMIDFFQNDVENLSDFLGRDLSRWLEPERDMS